MRIPFLELARESRRDRTELERTISRVLCRGWYVLGPELEEFEREFANFCEIPFAIGLGNGTDALSLAIESSGAIEPGAGDEVITSALSAAFTAIAIYRAGAVPRFADVDPATLQIDPRAIARLIGPRTRAILPVHLYGNACDVDAVVEVAREHRLVLIEDACQAHGSRWSGRHLGTIGVAGCFSFYPTKNLGALGDGGMVLTRDAEICRQVRARRHGGQTAPYRHEMPGRNSRLDEIQAAVLRVRLKRLESENRRRREIADYYSGRLEGLPVRLIDSRGKSSPNRHLYVLRTRRRDELASFLRARGIETMIHYPLPVPVQPAFQHFILQGQQFPEAASAAGEILSLPLYPALREDEMYEIADSIEEFFRG